MKKFLIILFVVLLATSIGIAFSAEPKKTAPAGVKVAPKGIDAYGSIKVLYPNGGEIWEKGKKYTIRWEGKGLSGNVKIMLKWGTGSGGWFTVTESAVNSGSYNYTVPKTGIGQEGGQFKIYVMTRDESIKDASDREFTITASTSLSGSGHAGTYEGQATSVAVNAKSLKQQLAEFRVAGQKGISKERQGSLLESMGRTAQSLLNQLQALNQQIARLDPGSLPQAEARRIRDRLDEAEKAIEESKEQRMHDEAEQGKGSFEGFDQKTKDLYEMMTGI